MNFTSNNTHPGEFGGELQAPEVEQPQDSPLTLEWIDRMVRQPETSQGADIGCSSPPDQAPPIEPDIHLVAEAPGHTESLPVSSDRHQEQGDSPMYSEASAQTGSDFTIINTATDESQQDVGTAVEIESGMRRPDSSASAELVNVETAIETSTTTSHNTSSADTENADEGTLTLAGAIDLNYRCNLDRLVFQPRVRELVLNQAKSLGAFSRF